MSDDRANRLRALWKSGRDKYASFFSVLNEVRQDIGDAALSDWCREELRISLSIITKATGLLRDVDARIAKDKLRAAAAAEKAGREGALGKAAVEIGRLRAEIARLKAALAARPATAEVARLRAEVARLKAERVKATQATAPATAELRAEVDRLKAALAAMTERRCEACDTVFATQNPTARYCSVRCRVAAHRRRHAV